MNTRHTAPSIPFPQPTRRSLLGLALGGLAACALPRAGRAGPVVPNAASVADDSCHGVAVQVAPGVKRSTAPYPMPAVTLTRADGARQTLAQALDDGRPVMLNFIYTSCNTICPVTSQVFMQARELLGAQREQVNMISISIDPEQDTPRRLSAYAKRYAAFGAWSHYTGSSAESLAVQRAFAVWRGDKMNHLPLTLIRGAAGQPWIRLDGYASPDLLVAELRKSA
ncbi:SCO family protein [Leptothrix discophora]|uniref:SCO family protein n=1 Tax=Leptothrix discophora TaxID=89 RepID=A0ABT9G7S7_LEPDI|nr:SCO family protein [Leptothrix discophora]MDP4302526.1 SCO family protein [Leptothrix discophora]